MRNPLNRVIGKVVDNEIKASQAAVEDPAHYHKMQRWLALRFAVLLVALILFELGVGAPHVPVVGTVGAIILMWYAFKGITQNMTSARRYLNGYLAGRTAMIFSLKEAGERGWSLDDWAEAEASRDATTFIRAVTGDPEAIVEISRESE